MRRPLAQTLASGIRLRAPVSPMRLAASTRTFAARAPHDAFKYRNEEGEWAPVRYVLLNRYERLADTLRKYKFLIIGAVVVLVGYTYHTYQPVIVTNNMVQAFEEGYVPAMDAAKDNASMIPRPALHSELVELLRPKESDRYALVVGAHGTGKSTAVRKAARETPAGGINGVVYISVKRPQAFNKELCDILGPVQGELSLREALRRFGMQETKNVAPDSTTEPFASWQPLACALDEAAMQFREKHGRPMTLVIDNTQKLLRTHPAFLDELQDFAKAAADSGNLRVVFVSSDFAVATHMQRNSEWSRCKPLEVGESDITEEQAVKYLMTKLAWPANDSHKSVAQYIVSHITGTRFSLLNSVEAATNTIENAKAWGEALHCDTKRALAREDIGSGHPLFHRILEAPGQRLRSDVLLEQVGLSEARLDALVKANILAAHTNSTYTCAARHVVETFKVLRDNPVAASAPAGRSS